MLDEVTKNEIFSYIEQAVEDENFFEYKIDLRVVENYMIYGGYELYRANIVGKDHNGHNLYLDLAVKISAKSKSKDTLVRKAYRREMYLYRTIFTAIFKFVIRPYKLYLDRYMDMIPRLYKMFSTEDREVLFYNSLIDLGYKSYRGEFNASLSMKFTVMKNLAKSHASSFALRVQKTKEFEEIIRQWKPDIKEIFMNLNIDKTLEWGIKIAIDILKEENKSELRVQLQKDIESGALATIKNILSNVPEDYVVVHGDFWMNNITSKYEEANTEPLLKFINWQLATCHSPVLDIAYFLYFSYDEDTNEYFEKYVEFYHMEFCKQLIKCESDPKKLFPFTKLLEHFSKYSVYPLIMALVGIPLIMANNDLVADKCIKERCEYCENHESFENCKKCYNCDSIKYFDLKENLRHGIKRKILGILELHYKYFSK